MKSFAFQNSPLFGNRVMYKKHLLYGNRKGINPPGGNFLHQFPD